MSDYQLTQQNAVELFTAITDSLEPNKVYDISVNERNIGKWSMSRLWYSWMNSIAKWMASNGATMPLVINKDGTYYGSRTFNADDCHQLFTKQTLGTDKDGNRLSWSKSGHDGMRPASKGERLLAMQRVETWATERGISLMNPRDSEYRKLVDESEG